MARANPHWRQFGDGPTVAIFQGPHEYISPSWYTEPEKAVPTWNYAIVHVHGRVELIEGHEKTLAMLEEMVARFESHREAPWHLQLTGSESPGDGSGDRGLPRVVIGAHRYQAQAVAES